MLTIIQRRLELKISVLRNQAAQLAHERDLLRFDYIAAHSGGDQVLIDGLAGRIRTLTEQFEETCAELRAVSHTRYGTGERHDAL